jgi:hypothetical protein
MKILTPRLKTESFNQFLENPCFQKIPYLSSQLLALVAKKPYCHPKISPGVAIVTPRHLAGPPMTYMS